MWQAKKQKQLGNIKSNMATFFTHINLDPALADGIQFLDFKGLLLLGLFSSNAAGQPAPSVGENDSEEDELPERFRSKKKPTICVESKSAVKDKGHCNRFTSGEATIIVSDTKNDSTIGAEVDTLTKQTERLCLRDTPQPSIPETNMGAESSLVLPCSPAVRPPLSEAEKTKIMQKQNEFDLEYELTCGLAESTRERLTAEVDGMDTAAALEHVRQRRSSMKAAAQKDEEDHFGLALAEPICHGAHHSFDGILHVLKAKTSKNKGEEEWKNLLRDRLENDYHGFQHAFKTAHDLMNAGLLPEVSRELNPKNKKSLLIHRVRAVCDDLVRPYLNVPGTQNHLMTDAEFETEVYQLKNFMSGGSEFACSVCGEMTCSGFFFVPATMMWHPIGINGGRNVTPFNSKELGKTQFIVCGNSCDEFLHQKPWCHTCGVTEIKWSEETYVDPSFVNNIPSMKKVFRSIREVRQSIRRC